MTFQEYKKAYFENNWHPDMMEILGIMERRIWDRQMSYKEWQFVFNFYAKAMTSIGNIVKQIS